MDVKKVDSITFPVKDYQKSATWYADMLGLPEIWRTDEPAGGASHKGVGFGVGDNSASINLSEDPSPAQLIIQVERVDDARRELEAKGLAFEGPTQTIEGIGKLAGFRDPDGNRIALLDYTIEHGEA